MAMTPASQSKIFCFAPWSNLEILPSGAILPCCKFQDAYYHQQYTVLKHSFQDYFSSEMLTTVKNDFQNNRWPQGCERCKIEEASQIPSKRQLDYVRWQNHYEKFDTENNRLLTLSMAIGNTCNLKCIMCGPVASSLWNKEYQDIYGIKLTPIRRFKKTIIPDVIDLAADLVHIDVHGGEPFLSGQKDHESLLDHLVQTGQSEKISIHYTTNGTVWPESRWFEKWMHFKEVEIQLSIDGVGERYEYIRYPGKWQVLQENSRRYLDRASKDSGVRLSVAHTVSAYNIYYLDEIFDWCETIGLPMPWTGKLHRPPYLRPSVWPDAARSIIMHHLDSSQHPEVQKWAHHLASEDDQEHFDKFREFTATHDRYRGLDFKSTFQEMAGFI